MKIFKTAKYNKLASHGNFKYKCDNCGEFTFLTRRDRSKASIPRCRFCGSTWLDLVTNSAKDKLQTIRDKYHKSIDVNQDKTNFHNKRVNEEQFKI